MLFSLASLLYRVHKVLSKTIVQGTVQDGRRRDRQREKWVSNIAEWTKESFAMTRALAPDRQVETAGAALNSAAPPRPREGLRDLWSWLWKYFQDCNYAEKQFQTGVCLSACYALLAITYCALHKFLVDYGSVNVVNFMVLVSWEHALLGQRLSLPQIFH